MKVTFKEYLTPRYEAYIEMVRSYCKQMNLEFAEPSISDFLEANALTRDRLSEKNKSDKNGK